MFQLRTKCALILALALFFLQAPAKAEPVTMQVVGGDVRSVLLAAARMGNLDLAIDDAITGQITISMTAEPPEIVRTIAQVQGLLLVEKNGIFALTLPAKVGGFREMYIFPIKYASAKDLAETINLSLPRYRHDEQTIASGDKTESKTATNSAQEAPAKTTAYTFADAATNSLVFYGTAQEAVQVEHLLNSLDVPIKQVALEAKIVALSKDASKNLGVEWAWSALPQYPNTTRRYRSSSESKENDELYYSSVDRNWQNGQYAPGIIQFGRGPEGVPFEFYYEAKINALISDGKAKMLARPNITTVQGKEAVIEIGGEVPVPTQSVTNATTTTSITYHKAGIILRYTPRVGIDGNITATVHTEVSSPLYVEDIKAYRFQSRSADTTVTLRDGETMVIGGLIGSEESRTLSKVPFLGDLPILGAFFRNLKTSNNESELMIFLTAHVLDSSMDEKINTQE